MPLTTTDSTELFLMSTALRYDLTKREERVRSVQNLEHLFLRVCRELQPDLLVEAGAKDAGTSRRARNYVNGRIVAFEANPFTYKRFESKDNASKKVEYIHGALSNTNGQVNFSVRVIDGKESADGQGSLIHSLDDSVSLREVSVQAWRLDTYFPSDTFGKWATWVDVEGASEQTLTGAAGILDQCEAIYIEVSDRAGWENQWLASDVIDYLDSFDLVPIARDFQSRYLYNILFVRRRHLRHPRIRLFLIEYFGETTVGEGGGSPEEYTGD